MLLVSYFGLCLWQDNVVELLCDGVRLKSSWAQRVVNQTVSNKYDLHVVRNEFAESSRKRSQATACLEHDNHGTKALKGTAQGEAATGAHAAKLVPLAFLIPPPHEIMDEAAHQAMVDALLSGEEPFSIPLSEVRKHSRYPRPGVRE